MNVKPIDKKAIILCSLLAIVAGILFCALNVGLLYILFTIIGAFIVVGGVFSIVKRNVLGGILSIAVGVLLIVGAWFFVDVLLIVNGVLLCVSGIYGIFVSIMTKDFKNLVFSILTTIVGGLFFVYSEETAKWIFYVIGALLIALGIVGLISSLFSKKDKKVKEVDVKDIK